MEFEAPRETSGQVKLPNLGCVGKVLLEEQSGNFEDILVEVQAANAGPVTIDGLPGGKWTAIYTCSN